MCTSLSLLWMAAIQWAMKWMWALAVPNVNVDEREFSWTILKGTKTNENIYTTSTRTHTLHSLCIACWLFYFNESQWESQQAKVPAVAYLNVWERVSKVTSRLIGRLIYIHAFAFYTVQFKSHWLTSSLCVINRISGIINMACFQFYLRLTEKYKSIVHRTREHVYYNIHIYNSLAQQFVCRSAQNVYIECRHVHIK